MVTRREIQQLLQREPTGNPILTLYLDMTVGSDNKRSHQLFINKQRSAFQELETARAHREALGGVFDRIQSWLETDYTERNQGVALFAEVGGSFFHAVQLPRPLPNRCVLQDRPSVAPLAEALEHERRWGIVLVDREHMQLISVYLNEVEEEQTFAPAALPAPHAVQAGGYSQKDIQKRKAEETRQFYKDFAEEIGKLDQRRHPDGFVLLGTTENVKNFQEFLPQTIRSRVLHTAHAPGALSTPELVQHLTPTFREIAERHEAAAVTALLERVQQSHFATAGFHDTLVQLQEGKVDHLIIGRNVERDGVQCTQCGFTLVQRDGACPYCGGELRDGVDLVESMIRMAARQEARVDFVASDPMGQVNGVGALLRF